MATATPELKCPFEICTKEGTDDIKPLDRKIKPAGGDSTESGDGMSAMPGSVIHAMSTACTLYLPWAESEADGPGQRASLASGLTGGFPNASSSSFKKVLIRDSLLCA